jgi:hypothetical protein
MQFSDDVQEAMSSHSPTEWQLSLVESELRMTEKQINAAAVSLIQLKAVRRKLKKKLKTWGRL